MRRRITFLLVLLCLVLVLPVAAHSGGTDANGGHYDGGSYHYHHGYPAHQHTGGVCPYDFDDRTGWNSGTNGSSGSSASKSTPKPTPTPTPKPTPSPEPVKSSGDGWAWVGLAGFVSVVGFFCAAPHIRDRAHRKKASAAATHQHLSELRKLLDEQMRLQSYKETADALLRAVYSGRTPADFVEIPSFVEFGSDGLPKVKGEDGWGNIYTVYLSRSGSVAHSNPHCNKAICYRMHIFKAYPEFPLCSRCGKLPPYGFEWYWQYRKMQKEFTRLGVPLNPPKLLPRHALFCITQNCEQKNMY